MSLSKFVGLSLPRKIKRIFLKISWNYQALKFEDINVKSTCQTLIYTLPNNYTTVIFLKANQIFLRQIKWTKQSKQFLHEKNYITCY